MHTPDQLLACTTTIVTAYISAKSDVVVESDIPGLVNTVYGALHALGQPAKTSPPAANGPSVPIRKSVTPDYIICLEDGKKLKMLKRHLRSVYGMTPDQYRAKWGLPPDYPMVSPNYAALRSEKAKSYGLGKGSTGRPRKTA